MFFVPWIYLWYLGVDDELIAVSLGGAKYDGALVSSSSVHADDVVDRA